MRQALLVNPTRVLLVVGIVVQLWVAASFLAGPYGLGFDVPRLGGWVPEGIYMMHADGVLVGVPEVDIDLATTEGTGDGGMVDVSTGLPAVELSGPFTARVAFLNPPTSERLGYVVVGAFQPVLVAVVLWVLLRIVSSVRRGSPFTETNVRRMWLVAGMIGVGGTAASVANSWLDSLLISRSAAAPAFGTRISFEAWPLLVGLLVAVIALIWNRGVALEKDTEGLV